MSSPVRMTGIAVGWIGSIMAFALVHTILKSRCSPSYSQAGPGPEIPANANGGRSAVNANQCGTLGCSQECSQKLVTGTRQR
jgi:hypothetical protein